MASVPATCRDLRPWRVIRGFTAELGRTISFPKEASNEPEQIYVALNGDAVVYYDDPDASLIDEWNEWRIGLQVFAEQGVDLTDIDSIAIGIGAQGNVTTPGRSGKMYFDDIRLYRPSDAPEE